MSQKKVIEQLLKLANKQQLIITKLAEQVTKTAQQDLPIGTGGWTPVSNALSDALNLIPEAASVTVNNAEVGGDGVLRGKLELSEDAPPGTFRAVLTKLKDVLKGKTLTSDEGKQVTVSQDPNKISFIAMT